MEYVIKLKNQDDLRQLFGSCDVNLKLIEKELEVNLLTRKEGLKVIGAAVAVKKATEVITYLLSIIEKRGVISKLEVNTVLKNGAKNDIRQEEGIEVSLKGKHIGPKTSGQYAYVKTIKEYDIVFGIGPAGTGKTYLAMAMAVNALKKGIVRRIILTRPAIEAGESLGFLPGDMNQKVSPYLRPLYDALYDMMDAERIEKLIEMGIIEVAPLAYMRGRTFNDAFIILDEAQNCTTEQMKMFLTRLGFDSKTVITGDITQSDLPEGRPTGLLQAKDLLADIKGIKFVNFTGEDVVRHELVLEIIKAYENARPNFK
ncbi:MAG: PhoH family protein [Candidatus Omnitrophica bacterium]|nr:PhoH family protein [Candidatus Omnitrophota bacterium]